MLAVKKCMSFSYHEGSPTFIPGKDLHAPLFGPFRCPKFE